MRISNTQHGFVILFAVLISAIILLIGAGVLAITVKESILSASAREAQYAINAADAGVECILFDDFHPQGQINLNTGQIVCAGIVQPVQANTEMVFNFDNPNGGPDTCAVVTRDEQPTTLGGNPYNFITVISRGFNLCTNAGMPMWTDPLITERTLRVTYYKPAPQTP